MIPLLLILAALSGFALARWWYRGEVHYLRWRAGEAEERCGELAARLRRCEPPRVTPVSRERMRQMFGERP